MHYLEIHKSFFVGRGLFFFSSCCNESNRNKLITLRCEHLFLLKKMSSLTSAFLGHQTLWKPQPCETEQNICVICVQFQVEISHIYQKSGSKPPGRALSYLFRGRRLSLSLPMNSKAPQGLSIGPVFRRTSNMLGPDSSHLRCWGASAQEPRSP